MKLFIVALSLVFLSFNFAHAERTAGNGGGLAEMKAIHIFENLNYYLRACLSAQNPCGLTQEESAQFKQIQILKPHLSLIADPNVGSDALFISANRSIKISSAALYFGDTSKSVDEIAAVVLASVWNEVAPQDKKELLKRSHQITFQFQEASSVYQATSANILLHSTVVEIGSFKNRMLLLEDVEKTIELSDSLKVINLCSDPADLTIVNWRDSSEGHGHVLTFMSDVVADCGETQKLGILIVTVTLDHQSLIKADTVKAEFRRTF